LAQKRTRPRHGLQTAAAIAEDIKKLENAEAEALDGKPLRNVQAGLQ
jgi:hypothetical protein